MKLACVIHRYGPQATGGSEAHCRAIAQRLAARHEVTVLTSCATDYVTWRNVLPPGPSDDGPVRVLRFPVDRTRRMGRFRDLSDLVFAGRATADEQTEWFRENGPSLPDLLSYLERHGTDYDRVLFWAFRYAPTWFGLPTVADRAILLPTAEDDDLIRTSPLVGAFFARPRRYLFLTPEERDLVAAHCNGSLPPSEIIGSGLDPAQPPASRSALDALGLPTDYLLYLGRVDKNKGCDRLFEAYARYDAQVSGSGRDESLPLILAGPVVLPVPPHPRMRALGFVDDAAREALLHHAVGLVMPSPYESLSIVVLEAWNHGVPVIVNGRCAPLRGQVRRAAGGVIYDTPAEFGGAVRYLAVHRDIARRLGAQGLAYVDREYRWPRVMESVEAALAEGAPTSGPAR
jgi:glycosyltransferase involved in cell wall biosynthesis